MLDLTLADYQGTYDLNYSASQSTIGFYGNLGIDKKLAFVNKILSGHEKGAEPPELPLPVRFDQQQILNRKIPAQDSP